MKRNLSVTLSKYAKTALKPNVSTSVDTIVRNFSDLETLTKWMDKQKTSCLLDDTTMSKLETLSEATGHPAPRIIAAMIELFVVSGNKPRKGG